MLYVLFFLAVILTILYFTAPGFIMQQKFRGRDLYEILSEEEHTDRLRRLGRGVHSILYLIVYYPVLFLAIPLVVLWAILNGIGLQVVSYIATATIVFMVFDFGRWLWRTISGNKGKADILMDDSKRYRGRLVSEEKLVIADATIRDVGENIDIKGILLDEDDDKITIFTPEEGLQAICKNDLMHMDKETVMKAEIELKDGTRKTGRKIYILGEKPFKDFLRSLPDLILVFYLWYLVVVLLTSF